MVSILDPGRSKYNCRFSVEQTILCSIHFLAAFVFHMILSELVSKLKIYSYGQKTTQQMDKTVKFMQTSF